MRILLAMIVLGLATLVSAQVVVMSGKDLSTNITDGATRKISAPIVLVVDISPERDPENFVIALTVETRPDGKELECANLSKAVLGLSAKGAKGSVHIGIASVRFEDIGDGVNEGEFFLLSGPSKTIKLGKGLADLEFAPIVKGPRGFLIAGGNNDDEIETGTVNLRLSTKDTKTANTPVGGILPTFAQTVSVQRALLADKFKVPANRIATCD
jgi:hypothetical protein